MDTQRNNQYRRSAERHAEAMGITNEMVWAAIEKRRAGMLAAQKLVTTEPSTANVCRLCADAEAAPGHLWCQRCIDREDAAENALYAARVYRCSECLDLMDADAMLCDSCVTRITNEARPSLLDSINVWIDAHRVAFLTVVMCGLAYSVFAWTHRG